jgi:hypothetical protein
VSPWLPFLLETSKIIFFGLLQVFFLPNANGDRRFLWDELAGLLSWWDLPWCMEGDFNVTCFPSENLGEAHFCLAMFELLDFISELRLMDISLVGGSFTWSSNRDPLLWSRIGVGPYLQCH